jgi:transketolase
MDLNHYNRLACKLRRKTLEIICKTKSPHIGPSFSIVEILVALYYKFLRVSPYNLSDPDRDRFILSKGHACATLYAVLSEKGFISENDLEGFAQNGGTLEQHPNFDLEKGIEVSTGSLGHGLSVGAGMALAGKVDRKKYRICVLLSDGELNEGSVWEAIMFASHHHLNKLIAIVDRNGMQALGNTKDIIDLDPMGKKWESFGWHTQEVDGHDLGEIFKALNNLSSDRPNVIILNTMKGKGVSFMENELLWHYRCPNDGEYERAVKELAR